MGLDTPEDLFEFQLQGIYDVEQRLVGTLDELQTSATDGQLMDAFVDHRDETEDHVERLETVFEALGREPETRNVPSFDALVEEKRTYDTEATDESVQNALYLLVGRKAERLELTEYEGLLALAEQLDVDDDAVELLERNRKEDAEALDSLESISEGEEFGSSFGGLL